MLTTYRLSELHISTLKRLYQVMPPVHDLVTMAVREVFTPAIVARFGQMEDFPEEFGEWAQKQGLSTFWATKYWAAHWVLPSVTHGFEMLHRRVIDHDDLDMLLKAQDIMPFWREKLKDISYHPLTRVDVRRMYAIGVLDEEAVHSAYLDVGYNDYNASLMTDFTIAYTREREKELTKTDIIGLYKKGAISNDDTITMLQKIGYSEVNAELLVLRASYEIYASFKKKQISYIEKAYVAGKITYGQALEKLGKLDLPSGEVSLLMETWDTARIGKVKELTITNIKDFYNAKVITIEEVGEEISELGYNATDTDRFVKMITGRR